MLAGFGIPQALSSALVSGPWAVIDLEETNAPSQSQSQALIPFSSASFLVFASTSTRFSRRPSPSIGGDVTARQPWTRGSSGACLTSSPSSALATTAPILEHQAEAPHNKHGLRSRQQRAVKRTRLVQKAYIFMQKLRLAAEKKIGATKAEFFCKAFEEAHEKLVYKELSLDAAENFLNSKKFQ